MTVQIQISCLLHKPTDLDQHCLQRQSISGFSKTRVNFDNIYYFWSKYCCCIWISYYDYLTFIFPLRIQRYRQPLIFLIYFICSTSFLFFVQMVNNWYLPDSSPSKIFKMGNRLGGYVSCNELMPHQTDLQSCLNCTFWPILASKHFWNR